MSDPAAAPFVPGPPKPSRLVVPGALGPAPGQERHRVPGSGALLIAVEAGDVLTLRNDEGGQTAEILAADSGGRSDPGLLGATGGGVPEGLLRLLDEPDPSLRALRLGLERRGIAPAAAAATVLFGSDTPAGATHTLTAERDGVVVVAAPGPAMAVEGPATTTPLTVTVARANPKAAALQRLPDPLATPRHEQRIAAATAGAYLVRAGEYIQILDVAGRQCSDFQCFDARKLDRGLQQPLDVTTTRSLMGAAYPLPGLHAKYYDQEMLPLVEVIQDTCGRHDAFALACTAKYYDDIGYPGHVNCSENFNAALAPHGVAARPGWMAINFFFNTAIDARGAMIADEPWSRPGDYVLLRALTDLVCVSSACPDDTTPSNGWNPTDIHVRTYAAEERFPRALATRTTADAEPRMTKETAFHASLAEHTRHFVEYKGYWLAQSYARSDPIEEYWACREKAVVTDLSALRKVEVTGPDAEALLQYCLTRNVKRLGVGQVVYSALCYPHGGVLDDGTLLRLGQDNFRWVGGDDYGGLWLREQAEALGLKALVRSSTDQLHNIAVQGPASRAILKQAIWTPPHQPALDEVAWFHFTIGRIGDFQGPPVVVSRTGYTGELGYEVWCHPKDAAAVFRAVWEAGQPHGLAPMGLAALDMVRIEAGLAFAGQEFTDETDPFEAGIGFTVPLKTKPDDFIGREALIRRKEHPSRRLVGLDLEGELPAGHGDPVYAGRAQVGVVTSGLRSPILGKCIALARLDVAHAELGSALEVGKLDGRQKRLAARVVRFPHYDPDKTRPRS